MSLLDDIKEKFPRNYSAVMLRRCVKDVQENCYTARQFIFNKEASRTVGRFIRECPDVIADNLEFALPPYEICYIEVDIDAAYTELHEGKNYPGANRDVRVGFLFVGNRVYPLVSENKAPESFLALVGTYFKKRGPDPENVISFTDPELQVLGSTYASLDSERRKKFTQYFGIFGLFQGTDILRRAGADPERVCQGSYGEARTIAAILLMLYNKKHVILRDMPYERRISRGKLRTYMAHTIVEISLTDPIEIRRSFNTGTGSPKRRHEVRTHYAHRRIATRCEHQWVRNDYADNEQWECSKCGGLRFLKREHLRGDGSIGFVKKTYEVKP